MVIAAHHIYKNLHKFQVVWLYSDSHCIMFVLSDELYCFSQRVFQVETVMTPWAPVMWLYKPLWGTKPYLLHCPVPMWAEIKTAHFNFCFVALLWVIDAS